VICRTSCLRLATIGRTQIHWEKCTTVIKNSGFTMYVWIRPCMHTYWFNIYDRPSISQFGCVSNQRHLFEDTVSVHYNILSSYN